MTVNLLQTSTKSKIVPKGSWLKKNQRCNVADCQGQIV